MELTQINRRKVNKHRLLKTLIGIAIVAAILTLPKLYPCQPCKKTGFVPDTSERVPCGACSGNGRLSLWTKFIAK